MFTKRGLITPDQNIGSASPVITKRFNISGKPTGAVLYITGLGFFEARLNGKRIGNEYFRAESASDYEKRKFDKITYPCRDSFTHRIYYNHYDISEYLNEGENLLEVQLGGGWYIQTERTRRGQYVIRRALQMYLRASRRGRNRPAVSDGSEEWKISRIICS